MKKYILSLLVCAAGFASTPAFSMEDEVREHHPKKNITLKIVHENISSWGQRSNNTVGGKYPLKLSLMMQNEENDLYKESAPLEHIGDVSFFMPEEIFKFFGPEIVTMPICIPSSADHKVRFFADITGEEDLKSISNGNNKIQEFVYNGYDSKNNAEIEENSVLTLLLMIKANPKSDIPGLKADYILDYADHQAGKFF